MKRIVAGVACAAFLVLVAPPGHALPGIVVVDVPAGPLDADRVRAAVGRELGMIAVAPGDPRAANARARLTIEARRDTNTLTVSYVSSASSAPAPALAPSAVRRTVRLAENAAGAEASAVILAGNLGRDEAGELLAGMKNAKTAGGAPAEPTAEQVRALAVLKEQTSAYEKGAQDYRDTVASIVKLTYEAKKKEALAGLDREIVIETRELVKARDNAIKKLEGFLAAHGQDPQTSDDVPDAMYRLAALYEERARAEDAVAAVDVGLKDAIRLYKRAIREYPTYRELAGVHYFLGHALNDAGRVAEAQQVWRALACKNHFTYPAPIDPRDPDRDVVVPMPQDGSGARRKDEEYLEVYPADCTTLAQPLRPGDEPRYVAEVWWQIGNWEFDQLDVAAGAFGYNRAASAYARGLAWHKAPLYGVTLYKYAWTLYKQQRYELATAAFVKLLAFTDEEEKRTGDPGLDFRSEATTYIAGSLVNLDFKGPTAKEPFAPRPDVLDTEPNADKAEQKLHVAIDRVNDPRIVPHDKRWTADVYRALADEFRGMNQLGNAVEVYETVLRRWPMDAKAPAVVAAVADVYDQRSALARPGTPERDRFARAALAARTGLAGYVGNSPWVDKNRDDPGAIHEAERIVRAGLRRAAVEHTNAARAEVAAANGLRDPQRLIASLARAAEEYELAARGWQGYLALPSHLVPDAYEAGYWNADARRSRVRIGVRLHGLAPKTYAPPASGEIDDALAAARLVRDSNEDDAYKDVAALFVVDLTDVTRDLAYARFRETGGAAGVPLRDAVKFDRADPGTRVPVKDPVPAVVEASFAARDEYARIVPASRDPEKNAAAYAYYVGETLFLYGQWGRARESFEPMWRERCGVDAYGFKAWEKLLTMAALERDEARAVALTDAVDPAKGGKTCGAGIEVTLTDRVRAEAAFAKARTKFEEACEAKIGDACKDADAPRKKRTWRDAASLYEAAMALGASRERSAEGAMNAAFAYSRIGDHAKAASSYERFLGENGANEGLDALRKSDPAAYAARVGEVGRATEALAAARFASFDYLRAASTYDELAANARFDDPIRRRAAANATRLYASLGDKRDMLAAHRTLAQLRRAPGDDDEAAADYAVASFDSKRWDARVPERDRREATAALVRYVDEHRKDPPALRYVIEASHAIARMKRAAGEADAGVWSARTASAWGELDAKNPGVARQAPYVDVAAEASFTLLDDEISGRFDGPARRTYPGSSADVLRAYRRLAEDAMKWDQRLEDEVIRKYPSREWVAAAYARRGAIFDALRSGLYAMTKVRPVDANGERLLEKMRASGQPALVARADEIEDSANELWRTKKQQELDGADELMVRRYASAVAMARAYDVKNPHASRAALRLAYFTDLLGDAKMRALVTATVDPVTRAKMPYTDRMFQTSRPGAALPSPPSTEPPPHPVAP